MKNISALALIAALAAGGYTVASAQDAGVGVGVDAGVDVGDDVGVDADVDAGVDAGDEGVGVDADVDAGADVGDDAAAGVGADVTVSAGDYTYEDVRGALDTVADLDLTVITDETEIHIVPLSTVSGDDDATAFITGEADAAALISETQTAIAGNAQIEAALEEEGYTADEVVAVYLESNTSVVIFVDDTATDDAATDDAPADDAAAEDAPAE